MWTLLLLTGLASPPDGVDPDDIQHYSAQTARALKGPPGCWTFEAELTETVTLESKANFFRRAESHPSVSRQSMKGRIEDGTWTNLDFVSLQRGDMIYDGLFEPLFGTVAKGAITVDGKARLTVSTEIPPPGQATSEARATGKPSDEANAQEFANLLVTAMRAWNSGASTADTTWRDDVRALELTESTATSSEAGAPLFNRISVFPDGGADPVRITAQFPKTMVYGTWPLKFTVSNLQAHLAQATVDGQTLPVASSVSAFGSLLGFQFGLEQHTRYTRATRCD